MATIISLHERARQRAGASLSPADAAALNAAQHIAARADVPERRCPFDDAVREFVAELRTQERADRTVGGHEYELGRYQQWLEGEEIDWQHISRQEMSAYARTRQHLQFSSKAALMVTMRQFYGWAEAEGYVVLSPAAHLKTPPRPEPAPKALSTDQMRSLLSYLAAHRHDSLTDLRDEALLCTALYTGMRAAELAAAVWQQLDLDGKVITIPISKMARGRAVKLHPDLPDLLIRWGEAQGEGRADRVPMFRLKGDHPIVPGRVGKIARSYAKLLKIPLTAHSLRHTFATWSLRRSGKIYAVSKALGHKHLTQTEVYLKVDPADSAPAVDALPRLDEW